MLIEIFPNSLNKKFLQLLNVCLLMSPRRIKYVQFKGYWAGYITDAPSSGRRFFFLIFIVEIYHQ